MKTIEDVIQQQFGSHIESMTGAADSLSDVISKAGQCLVDSLLNEGKIFIGGQGASCANAFHFSSALLNRYEVERPSLPVIHLTSHFGWASEDHQDPKMDPLFARQILALGQPQDMLILLTTNGHAMSLLHALEAAHEKGLSVIVLSGQEGGLLPTHLKPNDLEIRIPLYHPARIREMHLFVLHCFCHVIEYALFGHEGETP